MVKLGTVDDETTVSGLEPWNLEHLIKLVDEEGNIEHVDDKDRFRRAFTKIDMLPSAERLRTHGQSALTLEERAFWHSFMSMGCPLPAKHDAHHAGGQIDANITFAAFEEAVPDTTALKDAVRKAKTSCIARQDEVGFFVSKTDIYLTALPDWVKAAVVINSKAETWELVACGHHALLQLPLLTSHLHGEWSGHRYRIQQRSLPSMDSMSYAFALLRQGVIKPKDSIAA
jgi:hypothetical protein